MFGYSKLAKKPLPIPNDVRVSIGDGMVFAEYSGRSGSLALSPDVDLRIEGNLAFVAPAAKVANPASVGTFFANLRNLIRDAQAPYKVHLALIGVGFKAFPVKGGLVALNVGLSHLVAFEIPEGIQLSVKDNTEIELSGFVNQVTSFADDVCKVAPWDPCLQSGVVIKGSFLRKKEGKKK